MVVVACCCSPCALAFAPAGAVALRRNAALTTSSALRRTCSSSRPALQLQPRVALSMAAVAGKTSEITMPALSSTMTEGKIVQWLKEVGDEVQVGEAVMVVESDKVSALM